MPAETCLQELNPAGTVPFRRRYSIAALGLAVSMIMGTPSSTVLNAQGPQRSVIDIEKEYNVKGAFLYSFGRYVEWPSSIRTASDTPFVIGVVGKAPMQTILDRIRKSKRIQGRPITVRYYESAKDCELCEMIFVAKSLDEKQQRELINRTKNQPVLIIGETPTFAKQGGVISFYIERESVRFEINVEAAKQRRLSIDGKLLRIARLVKPD